MKIMKEKICDYISFNNSNVIVFVKECIFNLRNSVWKCKCILTFPNRIPKFPHNSIVMWLELNFTTPEEAHFFLPVM